MTKKERAKMVSKAIRLALSSLRSHLRYTYEKPADGDNAFHKKCVKEYAESIKILSELY